MKCWHKILRAAGKRASCGHTGRLRPCGERICGLHLAAHVEHCKACYRSTEVAA